MNNVTIHLCLVSIDMMEVVILYEIIFDMSDRLCVPNKTENVNVEVVSMISRNNELKLTVKSTSCDFRYRFDL